MTRLTLTTGLGLSLLLTGLVSTVWGQGPAPSSRTSPAQIIPAGETALPPKGEPGKCYARVWEDETYRSEPMQLLVRDASERIEIVPAKYEMVEQKVLVAPAYERLEYVPAEFETQTEQVLVKPATTRWKKGRGLIEKVNNFTGEIMCLEEIPAEYKTVTKRVMTRPAGTRSVQVPAEYKTIMVRQLVTPAQTKRIPIPAEYRTVNKTVKLSDGRMAWREVQCETNTPVELRPKFTELHTQSASTTKKDSGDWFFFWDYDELFDNQKLVPATK